MKENKRQRDYPRLKETKGMQPKVMHKLLMNPRSVGAAKRIFEEY